MWSAVGGEGMRHEREPRNQGDSKGWENQPSGLILSFDSIYQAPSLPYELLLKILI